MPIDPNDPKQLQDLMSQYLSIGQPAASNMSVQPPSNPLMSPMSPDQSKSIDAGESQTDTDDSDSSSNLNGPPIITKSPNKPPPPVPEAPEEKPLPDLKSILFGQNQQSTVENLKKAQDDRDSQRNMSDVMRAASLIGARYTNKKNDALDDMANRNDKRSEERVTDFNAQQEELKHDPHSAVSKGMRDMMKSFGFDIQGDASAADLEKANPMLAKAFEAQEARKAHSEDLKYKYKELATLAGLKGQEKADAAIQKSIFKMGDDMDPNKARTGELGKNQARLNAAGRVKALIDASGGNPSGIPMRELATTVGNMLTMGSTTSVNQINELVPHTMSGDAAKIQEWLTGNPTGKDQQQFVKMYAKIADREAQTAGDQMKDAFFQKAYTKYKDVKNKKSDDFYDNLAAATNMDPEEIKKLESEKGFRGRYKSSIGSQSSVGDLKPNEERRKTADGRTIIYDMSQNPPKPIREE